MPVAGSVQTDSQNGFQIRTDSKSAAIVIVDSATREPEITHIHFDGAKRYWIYLGSSGSREFFDRITEGHP